MNADIYTLFQSKCKSVKCKQVTEIIEQAYKNKKIFGFQKPGKIYDLNLDDPLDKKICQ